MTKLSVIQCPSVGSVVDFIHEPCTRARCVWWRDGCTAAATVGDGGERVRLPCALADRCRWSLQASNRVCPPMTHGMLCQHQGGDFNTFDFEEC